MGLQAQGEPVIAGERRQTPMQKADYDISGETVTYRIKTRGN